MTAPMTRQMYKDMTTNQQFHFLRLSLVFVLLLGVTSLSGCGSATEANDGQTVAVVDTPPEPPPARKDAVAVFHTSDKSPYTTAFRDGAKTAATEKEVEIEWFNVPTGDAERQMTLLKDVVASRYAGIVFSPQEVGKFGESLEAAMQDESAVVICERPLSLDPTADQSKFNFATTDHFRCGQLVADHIKESIEDGFVLIIEDSDSPTSSDRRYGVEFGLKESKIKVVSSADLMKKVEGAETEPPTTLAEVLELFASNNTRPSSDESDADADADGDDAKETDEDDEEDTEEDSSTEDIFVVVASDAATTKEILGWKAKGGEGYSNWAIYGSGSWEGIEDELKSSALTATILEDPFLMGLSAVMTAADAIGGKEGNGLITTGEYLVTAEKLDIERLTKLLETNRRE